MENVGDALREYLLELDVRSLRWLVEVEAERLRGCWSECEGTLDSVANSGNSIRRAETELFEPALTYFDFGKLRSVHPNDRGTASPPILACTRLLLGGRTALSERDDAQSSTEPPGQPGGCEPHPRHASLELCEPNGALYIGRTYFLGSGMRAPPTAPPPPTEALVEDGENASSPLRPHSHARTALAAAAAAAATMADDTRMVHSDVLQGLHAALWAAVREQAVNGGGALHNDEASIAASVARELKQRVAEGGVPVGNGWVPQVSARVALVDLLGRLREGAEAKVQIKQSCPYPHS